jgi:hypothetical protein
MSDKLKESATAHYLWDDHKFRRYAVDGMNHVDLVEAIHDYRESLLEISYLLQKGDVARAAELAYRDTDGVLELHSYYVDEYLSEPDKE